VNSQENIVDTINVLDASNQLLRANATALAILSTHSVYGERICSILDGIQVQQNKVIAIANELLGQYESRYGNDIKEVDDLVSSLMSELGVTDAR
jgi:pyruvate-formate lyase